MSIKPQAASDASAATQFEVLRGGVLQFEGRDAGAFLQAQLMNDVRVLDDGRWQWSGWLTPKGRVFALGALVRLAPERYWLLLPDHPAAALAPELRRFVFRSKVSIEPRSDLVSRGSFAAPDAFAPESPAAANRIGRHGERIVLDWSGARPRTLWLEPLHTGADSAASADAARWEVEDLAHGLPRLALGQEAQHTPHMLALRRLNAFSVKKGCYPGQEIVARTHFLGQAKRELRRVATASPSLPGRALELDGRDAGTILCAARWGAQHESLAVLSLGPDESLLSARDPAEPARIVEFEPGLAR
jgi:folate-binding protein YgfZ